MQHGDLSPAIDEPDRLRDRLAVDLDEAFPDVLHAYGGPLYSTVLRMVRHRQDAEDLTQQAFVNAYQALAGYPPDRIRGLSLRGWLWTIALNLCRNRARSRSRKPPAGGLEESVQLADGSPGPEERAMHTSTTATLERLLETLPEAQRTGVVLRHVAGLDYDEIAVATGRPVGTVKADVHRGLHRLRSMLDQEVTRS